MSAEADTGVADRRALEALRNGVPNGDAVRALGCHQPAVERRFLKQLDAVSEALPQSRQARGLLVAGGFGAGKSHLFQYLEHLALEQNYVCSRIVVSKETPLHNPEQVYRAAIEAAVVPKRSGQAMQEVALRLNPRRKAYEDFYLWARKPDNDVAPLFAATLHLYEYLRNDPELVAKITDFWSGERIKISDVRRGLRELGEAANFPIRAVRVRELALQRPLFAARLMVGAGYRGWVWLIDEVELIGRYSVLQRGKAYGELARWLGWIKDVHYPGLSVVAAITDDFVPAILEGKSDRENIGPRLERRGREEDQRLAAWAETGMRVIERETLTLDAPDDETLKRTYARLKEVHAAAYQWEPPDVPSPAQAASRRMRSYVRYWINAWDLKRLYPDAELGIEARELRHTYHEDEGSEDADGREPPGGVA